MEYAIAGIGFYMVYMWYNNTFVKPLDEAKDFIDKNVIEPVKETAKNIFEDTKESIEKTDRFIKKTSQQAKSEGEILFKKSARVAKKENKIMVKKTTQLAKKTNKLAKDVAEIEKEQEKERIKIYYQTAKDLSRDVKPITKEVEHGFDDVNGVIIDIAEDIKPDEIINNPLSVKETAENIFESAKESVPSQDHMKKDIEQVGKTVEKTADNLAHEVNKTAKSAKKQAEKTGKAISHFFGF